MDSCLENLTHLKMNFDTPWWFRYTVCTSENERVPQGLEEKWPIDTLSLWKHSW